MITVKRFVPAVAVSVAAVLSGAAQAQDTLRLKAARFPLTPMVHSLPAAMTDPLPLSGSLLRPLDVSTTGSLDAAETASAVAPMPAVKKLAQAETPQPETPQPDAAAVASAPDDSAPAGAAAPGAEPLGADLPGIVTPTPPAVATPAEPPKPVTTSVDVIIENVESAEGVVNVALCDKALSNAGCPYHAEVQAAPGFVEARFKDVPPGRYAVVGYHDVNRNDEFDKMLGVPREPYALSGAAGRKMVPTFKDAALNIKKGENTVVIKLQRLLGG